MSNQKQFSLLDEITDLIISKTYTNPDWAKLNAIALLSAVIGKKFIFPLTDGIFLNMYGITIGVSGARKTLPLDKVTIPLLEKLALRFSDKFTVEGMIDEINGYYDKTNTFIQGKEEGLIIRDEVFSLFCEPKHRAESLDFLCKLWSNSTFSNQTRGKNKETVPESSISLIGGTSPHIFSVLNTSHFVMGIVNRILWIDFGLETIVGHSEDQLFYDNTKVTKLKRKEKEILAILENIKSLDIKNNKLEITGKGKKLFTVAENALINEGEALLKANSTDLVGAYYLHSVSNLAKLSGIFAISRQSKSITNKNNRIIINTNDIKRAYTFLEKRLEDFRNIHTKWQKLRSSKPVDADDNGHIC